MVVRPAAKRNPEDVQAYYDIELAAARLDQYCFDVQESSRRGTVDHENGAGRCELLTQVQGLRAQQRDDWDKARLAKLKLERRLDAAEKEIARLQAQMGRLLHKLEKKGIDVDSVLELA
jgi:hypothetical protein